MFTALINSGFGWNDHAWDTYLRRHNETTIFRHATLQDYEQLRELCEGLLATGAGAITISSIQSQTPGPSGDETEQPQIDPSLYSSLVPAPTVTPATQDTNGRNRNRKRPGIF